MRTQRSRLAGQIADALGPRNLFWFGTRGDDARSLCDLDQFKGSFTILNRPAWLSNSESVSYEDLTGTRVDLDAWDIDDHLFDPPTHQFRRAMLNAMAGQDHAIVPYRPSNFLSALEFARNDRGLSLGLFAGHQHVFEHKPWVESAVKQMGLPMVPWRYIADEEQLDIRDLLADGPVVLRPSRGSGGSGMSKVEDAKGVAEKWPAGEEFFASVAPYLSGCVPLNVGAVVWDRGITLHFPSVQLIGIPECAARPFGYCGNDFASVKEIEPALIDQVEAMTIRIGNWLRLQGYRGAFGIDFMVDRGTALFTEINPRFQGSTRMSAQLSVELDQPCVLMDHIAAMLHLDCPDDRPRLVDQVAEMPARAQVIVHNTSHRASRADTWALTVEARELPGYRGVELTVDPAVICDPDAVLACINLDTPVTRTGYDLRDDIVACVARTELLDTTFTAEPGERNALPATC